MVQPIALPLSLELGSWKDILAAPNPSLDLLYANPGGPVYWNVKTRFQNMPLLGFVIWAMEWWDSPENYGGLWRKCLFGGFSKAGDTLESESYWSFRQGFLRMNGEVMAVALSHPTHVTLWSFFATRISELFPGASTSPY